MQKSKKTMEMKVNLLRRMVNFVIITIQQFLIVAKHTMSKHQIERILFLFKREKTSKLKQLSNLKANNKSNQNSNQIID